MRPVSEKFLASLRYGHVVTSAAYLIPPEGGAEVAVPLVGGNVTADRTAAVRRQASVAIPITPDLMTVTTPPLDVRTLAFGGYMRLLRGVRYGDGTTELAQLGYFRIESVTSVSTDEVATLALADRFSQIHDEVLLTPYAPSGLLPSAAARALVQEVFPDIVYSVTPGATESVVVDAAWDRERDTAVLYLARSAGCEAFFEVDGSFVWRPVPNLAALPVWTIDAGEQGVLVNATETLDRTASYNGVLAVGQRAADEPPVSALVVDTDPDSPTRWGGPFGKVARVEQNNAIGTVAQAQAAAEALLGASLGLTRNLELQSVPNPALVPGDVVDVLLPSGRTERHILDVVAIPLGATGGAVRLATRSVLAPGAQTQEWNYEPRRRTFYGAAAWAEVADVQLAREEVEVA